MLGRKAKAQPKVHVQHNNAERRVTVAADSDVKGIKKMWLRVADSKGRSLYKLIPVDVIWENFGHEQRLSVRDSVKIPMKFPGVVSITLETFGETRLVVPVGQFTTAGGDTLTLAG